MSTVKLAILGARYQLKSPDRFVLIDKENLQFLIDAAEKSEIPPATDAGAILSADQVMAEIATVASPVVGAVLRDAYDGHGRWGDKDKGKVADVALRDLALESVTMYRRKVSRDQAPAHVREKARKPC